MQVAVSILSVKENYSETITILNQTNCDLLHLDVMDGKFVDHTTMEDQKLIDYAKLVIKPIDIHLMVLDIPNYIQKYSILHPKYITFHYEATNNYHECIGQIKAIGSGAGMAINPHTPVSVLFPYLKDLDLVLIMSVEPGMGGQSFIETTISKIQELEKIKEQNHYHYIIEVDGGINDVTIQKVKDVDIVVSGSFVTNSSNYQEQINLLKK